MVERGYNAHENEARMFGRGNSPLVSNETIVYQQWDLQTVATEFSSSKSICKNWAAFPNTMAGPNAAASA